MDFFLLDLQVDDPAPKRTDLWPCYLSDHLRRLKQAYQLFAVP